MQSKKVNNSKTIDYGCIDPTELTQKQESFLWLFLNAKVKQNTLFFDQHVKFTWNSGNKTYIFELKYSLAHYQSAHGPAEYSNIKAIDLVDEICPQEDRFIVYDDTQKLGSGSFGSVYPAIGRLKPTAQKKMSYKKTTMTDTTTKKEIATRALKIFLKNELYKDAAKFKDTIINEFNNTKLSGQVLVKHPTFQDDKACMVMEYLGRGCDLAQIYFCDDIQLKNSILTLDNKIRWTLFLLYIIDAIHKKNIVHRDIKLENIYCTSKKITLFDYGLAKRKGEERLETGGTPAYKAPEQFLIPDKSLTSEKTDIFNAGVTLGDIWIEKNPCNERISDDGAYKKTLTRDEVFDFYHDQFPKFYKNSDLSNTLCNEVSGTIAYMQDPIQGNRPDVLNVIPIFETISLANELLKVNPMIQENIKTAHALGLQARKDLFDHAQKKWSDEEIKNARSASPLTILEQALNKLPHRQLKEMNHKILEVFIEKCGIAAIKHSKTKKEIMSVADNIINTFYQSLDKLLVYSDYLDQLNAISPTFISPYAALTHEVNSILVRHREYDVTLDNMQILNEKFKHHFEKIEGLKAESDANFKTLVEKTHPEKAMLWLDKLNKIARKDEYFAAFSTPMRQLLTQNKQTHLAELKESFRSHLSQYLQTKLPKADRKKQDIDTFKFFNTGKIKLNQHRHKDVIRLHHIIEQACTTEALMTNIETHLATVHRGFFGRSQLVAQMNDAINGYYNLPRKKQPALKA